MMNQMMTICGAVFSSHKLMLPAEQMPENQFAETPLCHQERS
jgi:hypothetical protein